MGLPTKWRKRNFDTFFLCRQTQLPFYLTIHKQQKQCPAYRQSKAAQIESCDVPEPYQRANETADKSTGDAYQNGDDSPPDRPRA